MVNPTRGRGKVDRNSFWDLALRPWPLRFMASPSAVAIVSVSSIDGDARHKGATLTLACGCTTTLVIAADRIAESTGGERFAVGKYPCPKGHPVVAR